MQFQLEEYYRNVPDKDLLSDIIYVKEKLNKESLTKEDYNSYGKYSIGTIVNRFGTWNKALTKVGFSLNTQMNISEDELFKNIEDVWIKLGRQPKYGEFKRPLSKYSVKAYEKRFGGWIKALEAFVNYINTEIYEGLPDDSNQKEYVIKTNRDEEIIHKTKSKISDRLRFKILMRDGFTCAKCGRSPLKERDVELHVDHILPWSKGAKLLKTILKQNVKNVI